MNAKANRKPRSYQKACLKNLREARKAGKTKALVVMASGTGKTLTSIFDLKGYLKENPEGRVLVLCHSADILRQIRDEYRAMFGYEYSYGMYNESEKTTRRTDFLFANLQSVNRHFEDFGPNEFQYIIVDEAHHAPAVTYRRAIEYFDPQFLLGLTATPDRTDDVNLCEIFGEKVTNYDLPDAVKDGWLSRIDYRLRLDDMERLETVLDSNEAISISRLNHEFFVPKRDEEIVRMIRETCAEVNNPTTVIFCQEIPHAEHIAKLMGDAVVIHSDIKDKDVIAERLANFRSGKVRTICTVNMLNEGIDIPRTDVIVFLRVTQSKIIFMQQLGRGLRLADGKDKVIVLDFVATADRLVEIFELNRKFDESTGQYPRGKNKRKPPFTLNLDTPRFRERTVDIIELIRRAQEYGTSYTNEELIDMLKAKACTLGRTPTMADVNKDPEMPSAWTYAERFGSFTRALILAGLRPTQWKGLSNEELIEMLQAKAHELGRTPQIKDIDNDPRMPSAELYISRFGTFADALVAAGLKLTHSRRWSKVSNEELLRLLRQKAEELGRIPTKDDVNNDPNMPSSTMYARRFGSFTKALERAGVGEAYAKRGWTNEEMLAALVEKAKELGRTPRMEDVDGDPNMPSTKLYAERFGSFVAAIEQAGLQWIDHRIKWTDEELLELLKKKAKELGRIPTVRDVDSDPNMPSAGTYKEHFGSFTVALERAGLKPVNDRKWVKLSNEELLILLRQKAEKIGRTPTKREVNADPDMPSVTVYVKRFGSFSEALRQAGLEPGKRQKKKSSSKKGGKKASG